jgi:hypothetical protein
MDAESRGEGRYILAIGGFFAKPPRVGLEPTTQRFTGEESGDFYTRR